MKDNGHTNYPLVSSLYLGNSVIVGVAPMRPRKCLRYHYYEPILKTNLMTPFLYECCCYLELQYHGYEPKLDDSRWNWFVRVPTISDPRNCTNSSLENCNSRSSTAQTTKITTMNWQTDPRILLQRLQVTTAIILETKAKMTFKAERQIKLQTKIL